MKVIVVSTVVAVAFVAAVGARAEPRLPEKVQAALESWLAERAPVEKATGIAAYVSFGDPGPAIEAFAGKIGRAPNDAPVSQDTLFQMGSTSKSFAAAVILKLEAAGKLSLDDAVGRWLPEYPAWKDVSIRRLLNMSSGIPTYSETEAMSRIWAEEPNRTLSALDLVKLAYPSATNNLPPTTGYHYSNTNYILAGMIAAKVAGKPYRDLVYELLLKPLGLNSTFYEDGPYPAQVITRLAHGYFENPACTDYQPKECKVSWNQPILGRDMRTASTTWAQAAGGAISNARDLDRWMRAVFTGRVVPPKQQAEWLSLISLKTGGADPRRLRRRSGWVFPWPRSRITRAGWASVVLRGGNTRLPNPLCLVFRREPDDHPADQFAATRGQRQDRRCDGCGARHHHEG